MPFELGEENVKAGVQKVDLMTAKGKSQLRFENLDGLRALSCIAIIGYHVKKWTGMPLDGAGGRIVNTFTQFVVLFMIISGFGIFCGYYERIKNNQISINDFYKKRYKKLFPYMAFVLSFYILIERSVPSTIEALTEATLVFGLLPNNNLTVLGIAWTVGVIVLFYMLFPFFVFACWTKRRACITLAISVLLSLFSSEYFSSAEFVTNFVQRHNFLYCSPFFVAGGCIYLFKDQIRCLVSKYRWPSLAVCVVLSGVFCFCPSSVLGVSITMLKGLFLFVPWVCYSISVESKLLHNKVTSWISEISLELYLAQALVYRAVGETLGNDWAGMGWVGFFANWILIAAGCVVFVLIWKSIVRMVSRMTGRSVDARNCPKSYAKPWQAFLKSTGIITVPE